MHGTVGAYCNGGLSVRVKTYNVLVAAIEAGIHYGYVRAHKHTDTPTRAQLEGEIEREIWNAIGEVFNFEDEIDE